MAVSTLFAFSAALRQNEETLHTWRLERAFCATKMLCVQRTTVYMCRCSCVKSCSSIALFSLTHSASASLPRRRRHSTLPRFSWVSFTSMRQASSIGVSIQGLLSAEGKKTCEIASRVRALVPWCPFVRAEQKKRLELVLVPGSWFLRVPSYEPSARKRAKTSCATATSAWALGHFFSLFISLHVSLSFILSLSLLLTLPFLSCYPPYFCQRPEAGQCHAGSRRSH